MSYGGDIRYASGTPTAAAFAGSATPVVVDPDAGTLWVLKTGDVVAQIGSGSGGVTDGDKGDVTVTGGGLIWTIDNGVVTYAKMQNVTDARLLGRSAGSAGSPMEITVGAGLSLTAGALTATGSSTPDDASALNAGQAYNRQIMPVAFVDDAAEVVTDRVYNRYIPPAPIWDESGPLLSARTFNRQVLPVMTGDDAGQLLSVRTYARQVMPSSMGDDAGQLISGRAYSRQVLPSAIPPDESQFILANQIYGQ